MRRQWLAKLVVVRTYGGRLEAEIARGMLEALGVRAVVMGDDVAGVLVENVRLLVEEQDAERAKEALDESDDEVVEDEGDEDDEEDEER